MATFKNRDHQTKKWVSKKNSYLLAKWNLTKHSHKKWPILTFRSSLWRHSRKFGQAKTTRKISQYFSPLTTSVFFFRRRLLRYFKSGCMGYFLFRITSYQNGHSRVAYKYTLQRKCFRGEEDTKYPFVIRNPPDFYPRKMTHLKYGCNLRRIVDLTKQALLTQTSCFVS